MGRTKAPRPRRRVGYQFEDPLPPLAAPLGSDTPGALFAANVSGPTTAAAPAAFNAFSGAPPTGAPPPPRPTPSLPFASLAMPRSRDATASSSSNSSSNSSVASEAHSADAAGADWRWKAGKRGAEHESSDREPDSEEDMVTISRLELERWQQKVIFQVEDHFTNEQLKRIAEFGRVHASLLVEAKQYVYDVERRLNAQLEHERASLRAQAEAFVAKVSAENALLRTRILALEQENAALRGRAVEDEDADMLVPASDEGDQENRPNSNTPPQEASDDAVRARISHVTKQASGDLAVKTLVDTPSPTHSLSKEPTPAMVTPTSVNQVPELELDRSPSASGDALTN